MRKEAAAWIIHKKTSVGLQWIADRLHMGHRVNVSRGTSKISQSSDKTLIDIKETMIRCTDCPPSLD